MKEPWHKHHVIDTSDGSRHCVFRELTREELIESFHRRCIHLPGEDGCIIWMGAKYVQKKSTYGLISIKGKTKLAHRFAYELYYGPIPEGQVVMHICNNKFCVRKEHLKVGPQAENVQMAIDDGLMPGGDKCGIKTHPEAFPKGEERHNAKLKDLDIPRIEELYFVENVNSMEIAAIYHVSYVTINKILKNETWKHVPRRFKVSKDDLNKKHRENLGLKRRLLTNNELEEIRKLRDEGWTFQRIGEKFCVSQTTIFRMLRRT
jgi:hypothetical protein